MTSTDETSQSKRKTLAIRLDDDLHQQVSTIARLAGVSVTDFIKSAIEAHAATLSQSPDLTTRAEALLADIDREAAERKQALQTLLSNQTSSSSSGTATGTRRPRSGAKD